MGSVSSGYELVDNSPKEIHAAIVESLNLLGKKQVEDTPLQMEARRTLKKAARPIIEKEGFNPVASKSEGVLRFQYQTAARVAMEQGALCQFYLERNWQQDELNPMVAQEDDLTGSIE